MATIKKPRGRMTKPLVTPYEVDDVVLLVRSDHEDGQYIGFSGDQRYVPHVGDVGVIKRIFISDSNDVDTFLMFDVRWSDYGDTYPVAEYEIASMAKGDAWLAGLDDSGA
jgi:hypothetical protein